VKSSKARPHSFLRVREGRAQSRRALEAHQNLTHAARSTVKTEDELESVLCIENDRAARESTVSALLFSSDDEVEELTDNTSPVKGLDPPPVAFRRRSAFSPPQQPLSDSPPPSLGDPVTPFLDPPCAPSRENSVPQTDEPKEGLELALKAHGIEGSTVQSLRRLGIRRIGDLSLLKAEDLEGAGAGLTVVERRLLRTAIEREEAVARRCREDMMSASRTWSRLTDDRGWYAPPFSTEPPGLRVTVLEPTDIAGTVMDVAFGKTRANLAGGVTRSLLEGSCDCEKFELRLRLGRADRTEFDHATGQLNFNVVGVSRSHAEIVLTCGDGQPPTCRITDLCSTNGTFLTRPAASHMVSRTSAGTDSDDESVAELTFRRPGTSSDSLLELKVNAGFSSDASGIPYLRLGPKLCLGLSLLRGGETDFNLRDVQVSTEKLFSESQLRGLGWEDACLDHVLADKRRKERVHSMLDKFAAGTRAVARKALSVASPVAVPSQSCPPSAQVTRDVLLGSPNRKSAGVEDQHIFLSYQWDCQSIVKAVSEDLKAKGYKVWLDLEQMRGDMNQRMAEAVEGAAVVCPFISRRYKASANCMKELNYSDQLGKSMLPIIIDDYDRKEMLRGAVGLITSNLIYVDLSPLIDPNSNQLPDPMPQGLAALFASKMSEMERALGSRGKPETSHLHVTTSSHCATDPQHGTEQASCVRQQSERQCTEAARGTLGGAKALPALPKIV